MASKRRPRRKQCGTKAKHPTQEGAVIAIRRSGCFDPLKPYKCGMCGFWHIGHAKPRGWIEKR